MVKHVVIMAGGSGTRLWPASRSHRPKQFLDLGTGASLFQEALRRSLALGVEGALFVVTHQSQAGDIRRQAEPVLAATPPGDRKPPLVVLCEPIPRNTAPAIAYPAALLRARGDGDSPVLVLSSDHIIRPVESFVSDVEKAAELAAGGHLVVFGIRPTRPETGYGYVETAEPLGPGFAVGSFHEKPDEKRAREYVDAGHFFWNSGMFAFTPDRFLGEARRSAAEVAGPFERRRTWPEIPEGGIGTIEPDASLRELYEQLPAISVDYAVMERTRTAAMVQATFEWSDVGSWDEVARIQEGDAEPTLEVEAGGNFVYADVPVALAGVRDLIVVVKDGVVMVCARGSSQQVRQLVEKAKEQRPDLL